MQKVFPVASDLTDPAGHLTVTAYALLRPDGQWALMVINKDQMSPHAVQIAFDNGSSIQHFARAVDVISFGSEQYQWHPAPAPGAGSADPDGPAVRSEITATPASSYTLPKASVTVLRGRVE